MMSKFKLSLYFNNLSIKHKLLFSYFLLIVIPLGIITILTYTQGSAIIEQKMLSLMERSLEHTSTTLSGKLEEAITASNMAFYNKDIQKILSTDISNYSLSQQIDNAAQIVVYLKNLEYGFGNNISRVRLYVRDELLYSNENVNLFSMKDIINKDWYANAAKNPNNVYWIYGNQKYNSIEGETYTLTAIRMLSNYRSLGETIGVACIDIIGKNIQTILEQNNVTKDGIIYLVDEKGNIISSSDNGLMESKYKNISKSINLKESESGWKKINFDGRPMIAGHKVIECTGWVMVAAIPIEDILGPSTTLRNYSFGLMIVIGVIAYLLALYVAFFIIKRINGLIKNIRKAQQGDLDVKVYSDVKDEVGELERSFNNMIESIAVLMKEKYKMGQEVKNAELKALQAQINPHFLYNTLDLINWRAKKYQANDIEFLVNALAKFYKLSLSNGKDIISIGDELAHVEIYVQIQNRRFKNRIQFDTNVDPGILDNSMLKLILQPIVENSILHGIMNKEEKQGNISISAFLEDEDVLITVKDDGVGMDQEKLHTIFEIDGSKNGHGYGIKNVNERIKLFYGEKYGLTYRSRIGSGTEVQVRIPAS